MKARVLTNNLTNPLVLLVSLIIMMTTVQCTSGLKRLEKGDYDTAVLQAVNRLRKKPDHKKARHVLIVAYEHAEDYHMKEVKLLKASTAQFRHDDIVGHYEAMNRLHDEISRCPACLSIIPNARYFQEELNVARLAASKAHFEQGLLDLEKNDLYKARDAYRHFQTAKNYTPEYDRIDEYLNTALDAATIHVMIDDIPVHSRSLAISNEFFQNKIMETARSFNYRFVQFHSTADVAQYDIDPDQVVVMRFDDFVVGQTLIREKEFIRTKDSVEMGYVETDEGKVPVYGTARATLTLVHKSVNSSGLLDFQIVDAVSGQTIRQDKMPGTFIWEWDWGFYNGQEEALLPEDHELIRRREAFPPPPQQLFVEFTQPIFLQVRDQIRRYYSSHN